MTRNGTKKGPPVFGDVQFCKFEMTDEIEQGFEAWLVKQAPDIAEAIDFLLNAGYKLSLKRDLEHEWYSCALTGSQDARHNAGICMMTYSDGVEDVILLTLFKAEIVYAGQEWPTSTERRRRR